MGKRDVETPIKVHQEKKISIVKGLAARFTERVTGPLIFVVNRAGEVIIVMMMLLTTFDVLLRYFINRPLLGSYEITQFMLVLVVFFGLAHTQKRKKHLFIDLFLNSFSKTTKALINCFNYLICLGVFSLIGIFTLLQGFERAGSGESSGVLFIPHFPFFWLVAFAVALLCLVYLVDFFDSLVLLTSSKNVWFWGAVAGVAFVLLATFPWWLWRLPWRASPVEMGIIGIILLMALLFSGMHIGPVMAALGFLGFSYIADVGPSLSILGVSPFESGSNYALTTIPLFMLMGMFCFHADLSTNIYHTLRTWMGKMPGGLAMATVGGCAGFAAVSGSSLATAITMGTVTLPEMKKYKYNDSLACGCVAAGGSIGILIPPSVAFIIYGMLAEESVGKLFMAGIIPGILEAILYILVIYGMCRIWQTLGPSGPPTTFLEKIIALKGTWEILILFTLVVGGIYFGLFTPTEAAGIGAFGSLLIGLMKRKLTWKKIGDAVSTAGKNTAMLFLMLIGAEIFNTFLIISNIPFELAEFVTELPVSPYFTLILILLAYIALGCIMPIIPAIILTVPIFLPVITSYGYDPIWFGVLMVMMAEIGQITPPVGINVFALRGVAKDVPLSTIFKGITPFVITDVFRVALVLIFPAIALYLPSLMV